MTTTDQIGAPCRPRNPRGKGALLRDEILSAAMRLLDRSPATGLSLRMVAKEAGVAAPSVYSHFTDAGALMAEVVRRCWEQLGEEMSSAGATCDGDALATLKAQVAAYVGYAMARPSRYQLLFALQPLDVDAVRDLPGLVRPAYRNIIGSVERHAGEGHALPMGDAIDATMLVLSLTHGRIALAHTAPHRPGNAPEGVRSFVLAMLDRIFA